LAKPELTKEQSIQRKAEKNIAARQTPSNDTIVHIVQTKKNIAS
jgi:hypothetical protein